MFRHKGCGQEISKYWLGKFEADEAHFSKDFNLDCVLSALLDGVFIVNGSHEARLFLKAANVTSANVRSLKHYTPIIHAAHNLGGKAQLTNVSKLALDAMRSPSSATAYEWFAHTSFASRSRTVVSMRLLSTLLIASFTKRPI